MSKFTSYHRLTDGLGISPEDSNLNRTIPDDFGGHDSPKLKFLATVQFNFRDEFSDIISTRYEAGSTVPPVDSAIEGLPNQNPTPNLVDSNDPANDPNILSSSIPTSEQFGALGAPGKITTSVNVGGQELALNDSDTKNVKGKIDTYNKNVSSVNASSGGSLFSMAFALKQATRPNPMITYQDVNYYNFRTKIATKMDYGALNLVFYDDNKNKAHNIFDLYMTSVSPIYSISNNYTSYDALEDYGVYNYSKDVRGAFIHQNPASSIGPLSHKMGIIESIEVSHYYAFTTPRNEYRVERTVYKYVNPKATSFVLDELDMTQSDVNTITMTFNYDTVNVRKQLVDKTSSVTPPATSQNDIFGGRETTALPSGATTGMIASNLTENQGEYILQNANSIMRDAAVDLDKLSKINAGVPRDSLFRFGSSPLLQGFTDLTSTESIGAIVQTSLGFGGGDAGQLIRNITTNAAYTALGGFINQTVGSIKSGNFIIDSFLSAGTERLREAAGELVRRKIGR